MGLKFWFWCLFKSSFCCFEVLHQFSTSIFFLLFYDIYHISFNFYDAIAYALPHLMFLLPVFVLFLTKCFIHCDWMNSNMPCTFFRLNPILKQSCELFIIKHMLFFFKKVMVFWKIFFFNIARGNIIITCNFYLILRQDIFAFYFIKS